jgi:hypothetical protein
MERRGWQAIERSVLMRVKLSGDVGQADFEELATEVKTLIEAQGSLSVLVDLTELLGEESKALESELDFGQEYGQKIDKMAIVGDKHWMSWLAKLADSHDVRQAKYFDADSLTSA